MNLATVEGLPVQEVNDALADNASPTGSSANAKSQRPAFDLPSAIDEPTRRGFHLSF